MLLVAITPPVPSVLVAPLETSVDISYIVYTLPFLKTLERSWEALVIIVIMGTQVVDPDSRILNEHLSN